MEIRFWVDYARGRELRRLRGGAKCIKMSEGQGEDKVRAEVDKEVM